MALQDVLPIIRYHHERLDGSGYPDHLKGAQIPRLAQLFSIADVYDSLRAWRPYRAPMEPWQAIEEMRGEVARGFWNAPFFEIFVREVVPVIDEHLKSASVYWVTE